MTAALATRPARSARRILAAVVPFVAGALPLIVTLVFTGLPVVFAVLYTLGRTGGPNSTISAIATHQVVAHHGFTLGAYRRFFASAPLRADLWVTIWITVLSTVALVVMAWVLAIYVRMSRGRLGRIVSTIYVVPMFIPSVIASYALVTFWEQNGKLATILYHLGIPSGWVPGFTSMGVVLGLVWTNIPFAVILISSSLQAVPEVLLEAARDVGASWPRTIWSILVPLNKLPTIIVITFTATSNLGTFTIPDIMGPNAPQMLGVTMTQYFQSFGQPQQAAVMAVLVFLGALAISGLYVLVARRDRQPRPGAIEAQA